MYVGVFMSMFGVKDYFNGNGNVVVSVYLFSGWMSGMWRGVREINFFWCV